MICQRSTVSCPVYSMFFPAHQAMLLWQVFRGFPCFLDPSTLICLMLITQTFVQVELCHRLEEIFVLADYCLQFLASFFLPVQRDATLIVYQYMLTPSLGQDILIHWLSLRGVLSIGSINYQSHLAGQQSILNYLKNSFLTAHKI